MSNVKIGVIGVGGWGKNHLRVLNELGCLTAFCDVNADRVKMYEKKYGVKGYCSVDEMLQKESLNAVTVCTPTITHSEISKKTLNAGLHTFVEKPLTLSSKDGEELLEIAEKQGVILTAGYIERFNPAISTLKDLILSGKIGEPLLLEFHRESKWLGNVRDVGIILDTAVHDIDTARWIFNLEPKVVFARTGHIISPNEDFAAIILGFDQKKTAFIASNWVTPKKVRRLVTVCTGGIATIDFITQEIQIDDAEGTIIPRKEWKEPLLLELKHFIECVEGKQTPIVSAVDALNNTKVAEAALISSRHGVPIYLEL
ncbi:MAG: Gfo/Idh/MocA family oxidoreductase [Nitrososphaerales archaeon]